MGLVMGVGLGAIAIVTTVVRLVVVVVAAVRLLALRRAQVARIDLTISINVEAAQHRRHI